VSEGCYWKCESLQDAGGVVSSSVFGSEGPQMLAVAVICLSLGFWKEYKEKQSTTPIDQEKVKD